MEGSWLEPNIWRLLQFMQFDLNVTDVLRLISFFEQGLNAGVSVIPSIWLLLIS